MDLQVNIRTRDDLARTAKKILEPLYDRFVPEGSGILPGTFGQAYSKQGAMLEGLARPLWGIAPLLAGGHAFEKIERWTTAISIGLDPDQPGFWGVPGDTDQRYVEHASLSAALLLAPGELFDPLSDATRQRLLQWLQHINKHQISANNWRFFRVLANLAAGMRGGTADGDRLREDLDLIDSCYLGDGWYSDGKTDQRDHYIAFAMHYYGLIYSVFARETDPQRCDAFRERAVRFARDYACWFDSDGSALPYGRSLTYRFAHAGFWGALAFAGVEALPWAQVRGIFFRNLRWWLAQPIFTDGGVLSVGYAYPNLLMSEQYNGPGSTYWALKCMLPLALPDSHPFWRAEEAPLAGDEIVSAQPHPHMLVRRSGDGHVVALAAGQYLAWGCRYRQQKYAKFAYSTRRAFNVSVGDDIAYDSALALSDDNLHWRFRHSIIESVVDADHVMTRSRYFDDVEVTTVLRFGPNGTHTREHQIESGRKLWSAEGGFPLNITDENSSAREIENATRSTDPHVASLMAGGVRSWIEDLDEKTARTPGYAHDLPNQNMLFPRTMIPLLRGTHEPGEFVLRCRVSD